MEVQMFRPTTNAHVLQVYCTAPISQGHVTLPAAALQAVAAAEGSDQSLTVTAYGLASVSAGTYDVTIEARTVMAGTEVNLVP
jgi:hypothetical protein